MREDETEHSHTWYTGYIRYIWSIQCTQSLCQSQQCWQVTATGKTCGGKCTCVEARSSCKGAAGGQRYRWGGKTQKRRTGTRLYCIHTNLHAYILMGTYMRAMPGPCHPPLAARFSAKQPTILLAAVYQFQPLRLRQHSQMPTSTLVVIPLLPSSSGSGGSIGVMASHPQKALPDLLRQFTALHSTLPTRPPPLPCLLIYSNSSAGTSGILVLMAP